jgi:hypothetical protein
VTARGSLGTPVHRAAAYSVFWLSDTFIEISPPGVLDDAIAGVTLAWKSANSIYLYLHVSMYVA